MKYYDIVASEISDDMYDDWSEYRNHITDYIFSAVENHIIKKKLKEDSCIRLKNLHSKELLATTDDSKPTLAIWGAGGCNDIDIKRLAKYFKLILIDRDIEILNKAKKKYHIKDSDCLIINLKFWDIEDEIYKMFEALLKDVAATDEIIGFLNDIINKMIIPDYNLLPSFDYSVAIGLVSQLNSRFAALLYLYKDFYRYEDIKTLNDYINYMNKKAVKRFMESITLMTNYCIILGYELSVHGMDEDLCSTVKSMNELSEVWNINNKSTIFAWNTNSSIAGNRELEECLNKKDFINNSFAVQEWQSFVWPFSKEKNYIMAIGVFYSCDIA